MDDRKEKKGKVPEDVKIPSLEDEIDDWCEIPSETDERKSADDLEIDAWCKYSTVEEKDNDTVKKEKK